MVWAVVCLDSSTCLDGVDGQYTELNVEGQYEEPNVGGRYRERNVKEQ